MANREEEQVIIQQFLRFGETKSIAQEIILQDARDGNEKQQSPASKTETATPKADSDIKKFIERSNMGMQSFMRSYEGVKNLLTASRPGSLGLPFPPTSVSPGLAGVPRLPSYPTTPVRGESASSGMLLPVSTSSPRAATPPASHAPMLQPFDYRREHLSPNTSPASARSSEKNMLLSPQDLSLSASTPASSNTSPSPCRAIGMAVPLRLDGSFGIPIKVEPAAPEKSSPSSSSNTDSKDIQDSPEGVILNYSIKDALRRSPLITSTGNILAAAAIPPTSAVLPSTVRSVPSAGEVLASSAEVTRPTPMRMSSAFADQKVKHLRKPNNPMKRPWQPTPGYGGTLISPSGKKRVLCTACNKTFCDKGALKIHYSAVHLKEMHKCSVEGCNMMFSSRRSRNRHSANPNPKLHMPQARRKLPEGAMLLDRKPPPLTAAPITANLAASLTQQQIPLLPPNLPVQDSSKLHQQPKPLSRSPSPSPPIIVAPTAPAGVSPTSASVATNASGETIYYLDPAALAGIPEPLLPSPTKMARLNNSDAKGVHGEDREVIRSASDVQSGGRSSRKRKSMAPVRCAQTEEFVLSDDEGSSIMESHGMEMAESPQSEKDISSSGSESETDMEQDLEDGTDIAIRVEGDQAENIMVCTDDDAKSEPAEEKTEGGEDGVCMEGCPSGEESGEEEREQEGEGLNTSMTSQGTEEDGSGSEDAGERSMSPNSLAEALANTDPDAPLDKDNPRKCPSCSKVFQNHFSVKTHFQNVHLKLMHTCTVEGCNAAFPSKRSRDRHSSNLNLHRKLLSTTSSPDTDKMATRNSQAQSLRDEFLHRIYDSQQFPAMLNTATLDQPPAGDKETNNNSSSLGIKAIQEDIEEDEHSQPQAESEDDQVSDMEHDDKDPNSVPVTNGNCSDGSHGDADVNGMSDEGPLPDPEGTVTCHVCQQLYRDNLVLKEHIEKVHPREMYRCTIQGCDKIFSTRKSRNRHSQNDNLHRHLSPSKVATA